MRVIYSKPELKDLSQGSRIAFIRQFRYMTQDEVIGLIDKLEKRSTRKNWNKWIVYLIILLTQ